MHRHPFSGHISNDRNILTGCRRKCPCCLKCRPSARHSKRVIPQRQRISLQRTAVPAATKSRWESLSRPDYSITNKAAIMTIDSLVVMLNQHRFTMKTWNQCQTISRFFSPAGGVITTGRIRGNSRCGIMRQKTPLSAASYSVRTRRAMPEIQKTAIEQA